MWNKCFITVLIIVLSACTDKQVDKVRIGTNIWPGYEPLFVVQQKHPKFNDTIRFVEYRNASQVLNGIINNSIDVAAVTLDEAVKIKALGYDIEVIWLVDESFGADALISKHYDSIEALKGKKIAVETSALGAYFFSRLVSINNFNKLDFKVVNLEVNRHFDALNSGSVDAALTFEPVKSKLVEKGAQILFDSKQIPGEIIDVLVVNNNQFNELKEKELVSFLSAFHKTVTAINQDISPYFSSLNRRLNLTESQFKQTYQEVRLFDLEANQVWFKDMPFQNALIERYANVLQQEGITKEVCQCKHLINSKYVELVANER